MKAIYKGKLYDIQEVYGEQIDLVFAVNLSDPELIIDPTDSEIESLEPCKSK